MSIFQQNMECERCGYTPCQKSDLIRHLRKKVGCVASINDVSRESLLEKLTKREFDGKTYNCTNCNKSFGTRQGKYQHMKRCQVPEVVTVPLSAFQHMEQRLIELEKRLASQPTASNTTVNGTLNNNTYNIQNNIVLKDFGQESFEHLPQDFLTACFVSQDIPMLIENILYDKEAQHNRTVRLKSLKNKMIEVHRDEAWVTQPCDAVLDQLVNKGTTLLQSHYKKNKDDVESEMTEEEVEEVLIWLMRIVENNEKIRKPIKEALLALLDTYRKPDKFAS